MLLRSTCSHIVEHAVKIQIDKSLASDVGDKLATAFYEYTQNAAAKKDIMEYLEFSDEFQEYYEAFQMPNDDSFQTVDEKGKTADEYYLLECWMKNKDVSHVLEHASSFQQVWSTSRDERNTVRRRWLDDLLAERLNRVVDYGEQYNRRLSSMKTVKDEGGRRLMKGMRVIGCTTTAAAKYVMDIQSAQPDVVIVEEAGEILESHILTALGPATKQLVLIGDHKQLRPKAHYNLSVEKGIGYDLNRSLFERLVLKGYPHEKLLQQHRMRPEISSLVRDMTYPELTDAPETKSRAPMRGFQDSVVFVGHKILETEGSEIYDPRDGGTSSSKSNHFEADITLKCVRYLAQQGYGSDQIVVLTPYLGQLRLLYDVLQTENDPVLNDLDSYDLVRAGLMPQATASINRRQLRVSTIDNYQGEESDIVVASLTRSNERGDIGFLAAPQRLNVLISRARDGIILIGNAEMFSKARKGSEIWSNLLGRLREYRHIYEGFPIRCERHRDKEAILSQPQDFDRMCPDGGCDAFCGTLLNCGLHTCPQQCHQLYDHSKMLCTSILTDICGAGHKMSWKCHEQRPAVCRTCLATKQRDEKRQRKEHQRLVSDALARQQHDARMADLDAQIEVERQRLQDMRLQEDRDRMHKQRLADLQKAKEITKGTKYPPKESRNSPSRGGTPPQADQTIPLRSDTNAEVIGPKSCAAASPAAREWRDMKELEGISNDAIDALMQMTGLETVKARFLAILQKLQTAQRQGTDLKQERLGTVLLGNPGTGKTTVARLYAKFLSEVGAIEGTTFVETTGAKLSNEGVGGTKKILNDLNEAGGGAVFVDEAYQLVSGNSYGGIAVLDFLLAEIENTTGKLVFMFAGYEKQMEKFFQHNPGLVSRMPHQLKFTNYTETELLHMLGQKITKKFRDRMQVEGGLSGLYMRIVVSRLHRTSGQEGFGNARALENILDKITSAQSARLTSERRRGLQPDDLHLSKEDLIGPEPSGALRQSTAWTKLQRMIGLDSVKSSVETLLDRLSENYQRELKEKPLIQISLNRLFLGSPGTGKTTVAKLYGQILAELGILSTSECVIKTPSDFIGSVVGESEKNTKAILESTKGKVLVLDEAYMLCSPTSVSDPYRAAVIDTIVSVVHSVPSDDRAVLLLGYTDQMRDMLRRVDPGLSRRFPVENAFFFEDYNNEQLRLILDRKLDDQGLAASEDAKNTAIDVLGKLRRRPNFGNAGEVENLLSRAKDSYARRQKTIALQDRSEEIFFESEDFDPDFGRSSNALENCHALFRDVVGSQEVVDKLIGYVQSFNNAQALDLDPTEIIPFNFVFKGPPGTGKTTTARKIGTVFYDMGFLGSDNVVECSATDLIGEYIGQTGPKVVSKFDEALGQVLFIDEAYRLGEGPFAKEATDEVVDCLTKPRYKGKMLVILAGYEGEINRLLAVNPGLSSRFPEEFMFDNLTPQLSLKLLTNKIKKRDKLGLDLQSGSSQTLAAENLLSQLSTLPGWGNGRDIETLASRIISNVLKTHKPTDGKLVVRWDDVMEQLIRLHTEREQRYSNKAVLPSDHLLHRLTQQAHNEQASPPPQPQTTSVSTVTVQADPSSEPEPEAEAPINPQATTTRDAGVPDATWQQLQLDRQKRECEEAILTKTIAQAEALRTELSQEAQEATTRAENAAKQASIDDEARWLHEEMRLKALAAKRKADEEAMRLAKLMEERQREQKAQQKLRHMGVCPVGYRWVKQSGGYRCAGGSHYVSDSQLGL